MDNEQMQHLRISENRRFLVKEMAARFSGWLIRHGNSSTDSTVKKPIII